MQQWQQLVWDGSGEQTLEVDCKDVDYSMDNEARNQYSEDGSEDEGAEEFDDRWSYAATESGDESFKPADTEDEAEDDQDGEGDPGEADAELQTGRQTEVPDAHMPDDDDSDVENPLWNFQKARRATSRAADFLTVECINVTCFDRQMEAVIESTNPGGAYFIFTDIISSHSTYLFPKKEYN